MNPFDDERQRYLSAMLRQRMSPDYSSMPPYAFQDNFDKQAVQMQPPGQRMSGPFTPGMSAPTAQEAPQPAPAPQKSSPYDDQRLAIDLEGPERVISRQQAMADEIRGRPQARGREVGPLNVYVGPNWGESAQYAGEQLTAGLIERSANKKETALAGQRLNKNEAERALQKALHSEARSDVEISQGMAERQQAEKERAARASERIDLQGLALDAIEMEPVQYMRDDGSRLFVGYRLNEENNAVEPYNLDTGKKVNMGSLTFDPESFGEGKSFNEPIRFVDVKTNDERMLSWNKGGYYVDAFSGELVGKEDLQGWIPEDAMSESQRDKQVADWVKTNGPTLELLHDIQAAEAVFAKQNPEGGKMDFNWFTKQKGAAGDIFRLIADVGEDGTPTQNSYAAANTVFNAISRMRAGLSQTVNEVERIQQETGQNLAVSPEVIVQYWDRLKDKVVADLSRAEDAMSPRTMQALQRWRTQKANQGLESGFTGESVTRSGRGIGGNRGGSPEGTIISSGDYKGMTKGNDGKIYDENGVAVARWR